MAIVEVMKLMNHVSAPVAGTVAAVLPENGEAVEFGQADVEQDQVNPPGAGDHSRKRRSRRHRGTAAKANRT